MTSESDFHQADIERSASSEIVNQPSEWLPIEVKPSNPTMALFFRPGTGLGPDLFDGIRDERYDLGWWNGTKWFDLGTGHDTFESYSVDAGYTPSHYWPLPSPPGAELTISNEAGSDDVSLIDPTSPPPVTRGIR
jgi:hypothetical protein